MGVWKTIFNEVPVDNTTVWIRVLNIYSPPCLAVYQEPTQTFTIIATEVLIPIYQVTRWKNQ